jgi:hypothetical protein
MYHLLYVLSVKPVIKPVTLNETHNIYKCLAVPLVLYVPPVIVISLDRYIDKLVVGCTISF